MFIRTCVYRCVWFYLTYHLCKALIQCCNVHSLHTGIDTCHSRDTWNSTDAEQGCNGNSINLKLSEIHWAVVSCLAIYLYKNKLSIFYSNRSLIPSIYHDQNLITKTYFRPSKFCSYPWRRVFLSSFRFFVSLKQNCVAELLFIVIENFDSCSSHTVLFLINLKNVFRQ